MKERDHNPPDDDGLSELGEPSRDAITPRGGFMARPGLKHPPRHAVVVRLGDAPATEEVPLARASKPPPEPSLPPSSAPPSGEDEKVTLRAIPSHRPPPVIESVPPPSDMPVVASIRPTPLAPLRRSRKSGTTIAWAAAAGIVLGLGSVAMNRLTQDDAQPPAAAGFVEPATVLEPSVPPGAQPGSTSPLASSAPAPSHSAVPAAAAPTPGAVAPKARRSIF